MVIKIHIPYQGLNNAGLDPATVKRFKDFLRVKIQGIYGIDPKIILASNLAIWVHPWNDQLYTELQTLINETWDSGEWW